MTEPRFIDANKIDFRINFISGADGDIYLSISDVKRAIAQTPTEDVTPQTEIVRKIFDELDAILGLHVCGLICDDELYDKIATIKKKYKVKNYESKY